MGGPVLTPPLTPWTLLWLSLSGPRDQSPWGPGLGFFQSPLYMVYLLGFPPASRNILIVSLLGLMPSLVLTFYVSVLPSCGA